MSKKQQQQPHKMTRKEALAILHKAYDAVGWHLYGENATEEAKALREQVPDAFRIFDVALYGEQASLRATGGLCHICYLRMSMRQPLVCKKGRCCAEPCCTSCFEQLKAEQQLAYIEIWNNKRSTWEKKEVPI
jgi:hypothetical protein